MFWDSVISGLKIFLYWETYVAGIEYLVIFMLPMIGAGFIVDKNEELGPFLGCLGMIAFPALQSAALVVFTLTLAPIIFGLGEDAAWSLPWKIIFLDPWSFFKLAGVVLITAILLAFIPIIGKWQTFHTLILGGIILVFLLGLAESYKPGTIKENVSLIPGFWFTVGLIFIGGVLAWVGTIIAALLAMMIDGDEGGGIGELTVTPVSAVFGFIPLFIYGSWLGLQIRGPL